jgi:hypothetical protein
MAVLYIIYYNLIKPLLPEGRRYIEEANRFLEAPGAAEHHRSPSQPRLIVAPDLASRD